MNDINLDATTWRKRDDVYDALLPALRAPAWHGRKLDALNDSLGGDDLNEVRLPFRISIRNTRGIPPELLLYLRQFAEMVADLKAHRGRIIEIALN